MSDVTTKCQVCSRSIPTVYNQHVCNQCTAATQYVTSAHKQGRCPMCTVDPVDLYHSPNFYALDWAWCYRDTLIATTRFLP